VTFVEKKRSTQIDVLCVGEMHAIVQRSHAVQKKKCLLKFKVFGEKVMKNGVQEAIYAKIAQR